MTPWIDRVGLILQFLAFWFIAPEILGPQRMANFGRRLAEFFASSLFVIVSIGIVAIAWSFAFLEGLHWFHRLGYALLCSSVILIPKLFLYQVARKKWVPILIEHLSSDESFRRGLVMVGAGLYVLGFGLQFLATF